MSGPNQITVRGDVMINCRHDGISWTDNIGTISLDDLLWHMGESVPKYLPLEITIVSPETGRHVLFNFMPCDNADLPPGVEYYTSALLRTATIFTLEVHCTRPQILHLRHARNVIDFRK
jgi:hypothetical protein